MRFDLIEIIGEWRILPRIFWNSKRSFCSKIYLTKFETQRGLEFCTCVCVCVLFLPFLKIIVRFSHGDKTVVSSQNLRVSQRDDDANTGGTVTQPVLQTIIFDLETALDVKMEMQNAE